MKTIIPFTAIFFVVLSVSTQRTTAQEISYMNEYRESHGSAILYLPDNLPGVLACGGWTGEEVTASAEFMSPLSNEWVPMPDMLTPRMDFAMASILGESKVIVAGGYDGIGPLSLASTEIFDPQTNEWTPGPDLSVGRSFLRVTELANGRLLFTGGYDGNEQVAAVDLYDPYTNTMTAMAPMNFARSSHTATSFYIDWNNTNVLVVGGFNPEFGFQMNQCEGYEVETDTWTVIAPLNTGRDNHAALQVEGLFYVTGGRVYDPVLDHFVGLAEAEIYDLDQDTWTTVSLPSAMSYHHMWYKDPPSNDDHILVLGGANHTGIGVETTYDPPFRWELPETMTPTTGTEYENRLRSSSCSGDFVTLGSFHGIVVSGGDQNGVGTSEAWGWTVGNVPDNALPRNGLFPNPAVDRMRITGERFERWEVIDANGKIVGAGNEWYVEVAHLAAGRYNLTIYTDGTANTYGFVKVGR